MKITGKSSASPNIPASSEPTLHSDLPPPKISHKRHRRRTRLRSGAPAGKRSSRPETPLLKWKTEEKEKNVVSVEDDKHEARRRSCRRDNPVSARKLAAVLWRLNLPEAVAAEARGSGVVRRGEDEQVVSHVRAPSLSHRNAKVYASEAKDPAHSPGSVSGTRNGFFKLEPSFQYSNCAMESSTKWDPVSLMAASNEARELYSHTKLLDRQVGAASVISSLEAELDQARARILELETEQRSSKKKLEHFLNKLSEDKAAWRRREHEKIRAFIDDVKSDLNRERKSCQRTEIVNAKLVDELAEAKLSAKRYLQDYEKERKTRELVEEVCDELAKEIGEDKAELEAINKESMKFREEVEEERKMLQMAEVWREERVQMKLIDAKLALEEKYSHMNKLVADLENFLRARNLNPDLLEAELLRHAAASVNVQDINEFHYEPGNPDDIFSILEEVNFGGNNEREIEEACYSPGSKVHMVSPEVNENLSSNGFMKHKVAADVEEDESGWETVSNVDDQGSSYSPEGSAPSVNKNPRGGTISGSETPLSEVSQVCSVKTKQSKKVSSIARLWRSVPSNEDNNCKVILVEGVRLSNAMISNGTTMSPNHGSGFGPGEIIGEWSSPEMGNHHPHMGRGMKKGCMEWPRGVQRNSLKAKLLEARMESQKVQLRQVLKQKM